MYLLVNVLEQPEHLVAILEGFAQLGIKGSTVMNSTGMGRVLMTAGTAGPAIDEISKIIANEIRPFSPWSKKRKCLIRPSTLLNPSAVIFANPAKVFYSPYRWPLWMDCRKRGNRLY
jgi:hypothetical protein